MKSRWLIFVLSVNWYPAEAFLRISDRGIRAVRNKIGNGESPWKIPLLMFTSLAFARLKLVLFVLFARRTRTFSATPNSPKHSRIHECRIMSNAFLKSIQPKAKFFWCDLLSLSTLLSMYNWSFVPREPLLQPFCSSGKRPSLSRNEYISPEIIPVNIFHITGRYVIGL